MSIAAKTAVRLVRLYGKYISPLIPARCRFRPTCSEYFIEALERFGFFRGGAKGLWRILRCNPFGGSGYDPVVPEKSPPGSGSGNEVADDADKLSGILDA